MINFPFTRRSACFTLFLCVGLTVFNVSFGQTARFRHYSTDEGFTGASFKTMVQDSLGFLWISSGSGLYKFDGYEFTVYKPTIGNTLSLSQEVVNRIWIDPWGKLWAGFPNKISYYDQDLDGFVSFKVPLGAALPESVWFESKTSIWIGSSKKGLVHLDITTRRSSVFSNEQTSISLPDDRNTIREIKKAGSFLLLGTPAGLWTFDIKSNSFGRPICHGSDSTYVYSADVRRIFSNPDIFWIWSDQKLVKLNREFSVIQTLEYKAIHQRFDVEGKYKDASIVSVAQDGKGTFWLASQGLGLIQFDPAKNELVNFRNEKGDERSIPSDVLYFVMTDRDDNVWVTMVNKGIAQLKKQSLYFYNYLPGISTGRALVLKTQAKNVLAVTSQGHGLWTALIVPDKPTLLSFKKLEVPSRVKGFENLVMAYPGRTKVWVGTLTAGAIGLPIDMLRGDPVIYQHDPANPNSLTGNVVSSLAEDSMGNLWVGTVTGGLNKVIKDIPYGKPGSVIRYRHVVDDSTSIINDGVIDIVPASDGSLLLGTFGGLDRIRDSATTKGLVFEHLLKGVSAMRLVFASDGSLLVGTKDGLLIGIREGSHYRFTKAPLPGRPFITSIQEDRLGRFWLLSYEGLFFYDRKNQIALLFKKEDGLPSSRTISAGGSCQTPEGMMVFGNAEGLTLFDPLSLRLSATRPRPVITKLKVNNQTISSPDRLENLTSLGVNLFDKLTLDYTQNILTMEFAAMDFTAPEKNLYAYKLEGFENDWVQTDWRNRIATFTNLKPGQYTFQVKVSNQDGIWSDRLASLTIVVLPPPWKTWWAYALYAVGLLAILWVVIRNILQRERLASRLKLEHLELEKIQEIDKVKTNFFANISHEFRTPLTLIQGPIQTLLERKRNPEDVSQLQLIQQNADRLLRLVNQILELARLESGGLKKELSEGDVIAHLEMLVGSFSSLAVQKRITLVQQFPEQMVNARYDRDKLEKIVINLVNNALKFTPENGAIIFNVQVMPTGDTKSTGELCLRVTDTGRGIPSDQLDKIFERFYQVSENGHQQAGTGIGLALGKELAEFLGGSLTVESKVGEGSRFTLKLLLEIIEIQPGKASPHDQFAVIAEEELPTQSTGSEKPILLIVEDHLDLRKFIMACLGSEYQFLEASDGKSGLKLSIEQVPALILSDVMMPEMDGIEMCSKIKRDHRTSHIPVILLTAKATDESKLSGLETGADDYLIKPFNKDELVLKIRNQIAARVKIQEKVRLEFLSTSEPVKAISADEKFLDRVRKLVEERMGDQELGVDLLADVVGLSRVQLYRKMIALTGISVNEFIRKLRLQRAAQLLKQNFGPVSQVAYEVGIVNVSYFSKCFKEQFGKLPSEYVVKE